MRNIVIAIAIAAMCGTNTAKAQFGAAPSSLGRVCAAYKHGKKARFIASGSSHRKAVRRRAKKWGK